MKNFSGTAFSVKYGSTFAMTSKARFIGIPFNSCVCVCLCLFVSMAMSSPKRSRNSKCNEWPAFGSMFLLLFLLIVHVPHFCILRSHSKSKTRKTVNFVVNPDRFSLFFCPSRKSILLNHFFTFSSQSVKISEKLNQEEKKNKFSLKL